MLSKVLRLSSLSLALAALTLAGSAEAKKKKADPPPAEDVQLDEDDSSKKSTEAKPADDAKPADEAPAADADAAPKEEAPSDVPKPDTSAAHSAEEAKGETYQFVGARLRGLIIPSFVIGIFGDGGKNVIAPNFGPEFVIRRDNFEYDFSLNYASFVMSHTPIKSPTDPQEAMELVNARIKVLFATADFVWSHPFSPEVAVLYGFGAGLGVVWGPIYRAQAYPSGGGWSYCPGPPTSASPAIQQQYCAPDPSLGSKPQHYQGYQEPSWANGGSKPVVFPWLAVQTGLRFKASHEFVARVDLGLALGWAFLGVGADYGL